MRFLAFCTRYCQVVQKRFEYIRSCSNTLLESRDDEGLRKISSLHKQPHSAIPEINPS